MTAPSLDPPSGELVTIDVVRHRIHGVASPPPARSTPPPLRSSASSSTPCSTARSGELTVDLGRVTFLDSAGLCVLAAAHRRAVRQDVRMRVLASSRAVIRPLQITGLWELLHAEQIDSADRASSPDRSLLRLAARRILAERASVATVPPAGAHSV